MKKVTRTEVEINELFDFALEKYGRHWNYCCDIFERTQIIPFRGVRDFELEDAQAILEDWLEEKKSANPSDDVDKQIEAYTILIAFMQEYNLKEMRFVREN